MRISDAFVFAMSVKMVSWSELTVWCLSKA